MQPPFRNGFTLIEIVSVLVVLGVLAYLGISAFRGNDEITAYAERDRLLSQLVYARAQGMAMGGGQCVTIDTNKVSFFMKGKSALPTLLKDYTPSASIQSTPPATFCFDAAGSVCGEDSLGNPNDTGILYCTASASDQTFSFGGGITLTLFRCRRKTVPACRTRGNDGGRIGIPGRPCSLGIGRRFTRQRADAA